MLEPPPTALRPGAIRNYILFTIVLPTLGAFLLTAGLSTTYLVRLLTHFAGYDKGFILVDEGDQQRGLTISSLTSYLVTMVNPLVMSLLAYIAALRWLAAQTSSGMAAIAYSKELPTPLQFGLMLRLLSVGGIFSLWDSARYLIRKETKRATAPHVFKAVFAIALLSYILTHAIAGVDFHLHYTASTTTLNMSSPLPSAPNYSIIFDNSLCAHKDGGDNNNKCLVSDKGWAVNNTRVANIGLQVASNTSPSLSLITFNNAIRSTVLKPRDTETRVEFRARTYGARASCRSINHLCMRAGGETKNCTNIRIPELPISSNYGVMTGDPVTSVIIGRIGNVSVGRFHSYYETQRLLPPIPTTILLHLRWPSYILLPSYPHSEAIDIKSTPFVNLYAECELSFFTAMLKRSWIQDQERYILEEEKDLDSRMADILLPPLLYQHATDILASNLHATALSETNISFVESRLSQELSRMAIGIAAGLFKLEPTEDNNLIRHKIVARYHFMSVFLLASLLYSYAILVLSIIIWGLVDFHRGNRRLFQDIAIAQLKLSNPMVVVATLFPSMDMPVAPETCAMELFDEKKTLEGTLRLYVSGNRMYGLQDWNSPSGGSTTE